MQDLTSIRDRINQMAELVLSMLRRTFEGFIQHNLDILTNVLKDEHRLNETERELTRFLVDLSKIGIVLVDKKVIRNLADIIDHLEEIGDYVKDMIERIEIKIQEKLLFSNEALEQYKHLYGLVESTLSKVVDSLKSEDKEISHRVLRGKADIHRLIEEYRSAHTQRLISGICDTRAGNMFLNLLDFTGQIYNHSLSVAKIISES
ncbi:MAG: hypothetical protein NC908_02270 [Candidatus Omnitrophica bacterium]|nr:hypothetical protein [Candidatus Omnitrophota bacterium]